MKTTRYEKPAIEVAEMEGATLMAASIVDDGTMVNLANPGTAQQETGRAKGYDIWDFEEE